MRMRDVEWGHVLNSSGARGFAGEGYWFHDLFRPLGLRYTGSTFVSKTTTLSRRSGNMRLGRDHQPARLVPDCIVVKPMAGVVLNAVGLSGPGAEEVLQRLRWKPPFWRSVVSFMSVEPSPEARVSEATSFLDLFRPFVTARGRSNVALQVNFSCPNVGLDTSHLIEEVDQVLDRTVELGVPTMVKISALVPPEVACEIGAHDGCDAIVCSNTIPWGQMPDAIDWERIFGSTTSPLQRYGGGGLSGKPLLPLVEAWIRHAVGAGMKKPIVGGGGVLCQADAERLIVAGASAIELGSVSILRPWRVASIISYVNSRLARRPPEEQEHPTT